MVDRIDGVAASHVDVTREALGDDQERAELMQTLEREALNMTLKEAIDGIQKTIDADRKYLEEMEQA